MSTRLGAIAVLLLACAAPAARAQPSDAPPPPDPNGERLFGFEFEFAGLGNRIVHFEEMPWENYERLMRVIVDYYGGNPADIRRVDFTKPTTNLERFPSGERELFRAEWRDPAGRNWKIEPEYVASTGLDGYELVTPPLDSPRDLEEILRRIRDSGLVREGLKSGVHLNLDGRRLVTEAGDARALANLIVMHENMEPMLRRLFNPVRGGGHANRFARSLAVDHGDLLREIDALPEEERTRERLSELFRAREAREAALHGADPMDPNSWTKLWKYRSLNLAKVLDINALHDGRTGVVEFRMFDNNALQDPEIHRLQAEVYRAMIRRAEEMAARGETVRYRPRAPMPEGENPSVYNTPDDPREARAQAREMLEMLGVDPANFEELLERRLRPRELRTAAEFRGAVDVIETGRITHNGEAFTYGFELEGRGSDVVRIMVPTDAEVASRWDAMSLAEKKAHYDRTVGESPGSVKSHFEVDTRLWWLDPYWYVEATGNWEIHSKVFDNLTEAMRAMREAKSMTGRAGRGFHLHMRDNAPDWEHLRAHGSEFADFIRRSADWVWLKRIERLRTDLSMKAWSNARMTDSAVNTLAELNSTGRATVRMTMNQPSYIDLEIRGLTMFVDDIELLAKIYTDRLKSGEFGSWRHTDRTQPSSTSPRGNPRESLSFIDHMEEYLRTVEGRPMTPELRRILEGLQGDYLSRAGGRSSTHLAPNLATPLLPWDADPALPETTRRDLRFQREEFLRSLLRRADRIADGRYGIDLEVASETALRELGLTSEEARAVVEARRAAGGFDMEESLRALATRSALPHADAAIGALEGIDLNTADAERIAARLGVDPEVARRLVEVREARLAEVALGEAGVAEAEVERIRRASEALDLSLSEATVERIVERTGLAEDAARRIVDLREAHEVRSAEDLRAAGLSEAEATRVLELAGPGVDLSALSAEELRDRLGISLTKARALLAAGQAGALNQWEDLRRAGLSAAAIGRLREAGRTLEDIRRLSAAELAASGLTESQAERLTRYRDALDVNAEETLRRVLGEAEGTRAAGRIAGLDLATASAEALERAGVEAETARRLVAYRDANSIGRPSTWSDFDPERAARELREAGLLSEADARRVAERTGAVDLEAVDAERLAERFGVELETARRFVTLRDAHDLTSREALERAGISGEEAERLIERARPVDLSTASAAEIAARTGLSEADANRLRAVGGMNLSTADVTALVEAGLSREAAERLVAFREGARNLGPVDYAEMVRHLRLNVREWVRNSALSETLLRSLLPREGAARMIREARATAEATEGEGFGRTRAGAPGAVAPSRISIETVEAVFGAVKEAAIARATLRSTSAESEAERAAAARGVETLRSLGLDVVESNDVLARYAEGRVRVSTGLLNEIDARASELPAAERVLFRLRVLGLIMGHEAAHASGIRAERIADAEGVRILEGSRLGRAGIEVPVTSTEMREAVRIFSGRPTGASHLDGVFTRLRDAFRYGTATSRLENMERAGRGAPDALSRYRRADGTLRWREVVRDRALREVGGLAHFGLALFLKELAVVAKTGDRARIEEFFDGLMTTDFYKHYGLFVLGARAGEVAYARYLERYIKPRFVNGVMKTNLVLAMGIALPQLVDGTFEGKAFAITLSSLGLSSAAVKAGMRGISWVVDLKRARDSGLLARLGLGRGARLARLGGWLYTAAELAVVLYFAEEMEKAVHGYLDREAAEEALADAGEAFLAAVQDPAATPESVAAAGDAYHDAWTDYRNFLYSPLSMDEAVFVERLERVARAAKLTADEREARLERVRSQPALRRNIEARYGSVEAYAEAMAAEDEAEAAREVEMYVNSYEMSRAEHLREVYEENRRGRHPLAEVEHLDWLLAGGRDGAANDPWGGRGDPFAALGRRRARGELRDALESPSRNRDEAYADEAAIVSAVASALRGRGRGELAEALAPLGERVTRTRELDRRLIEGDGMVDLGGSGSGPGLAGIIEAATAEGPESAEGEGQ